VKRSSGAGQQVTPWRSRRCCETTRPGREPLAVVCSDGAWGLAAGRAPRCPGPSAALAAFRAQRAGGGEFLSCGRSSMPIPFHRFQASVARLPAQPRRSTGRRDPSCTGRRALVGTWSSLAPAGRAVRAAPVSFNPVSNPRGPRGFLSSANIVLPQLGAAVSCRPDGRRGVERGSNWECRTVLR
jgi:hypothetical protein